MVDALELERYRDRVERSDAGPEDDDRSRGGRGQAAAQPDRLARRPRRRPGRVRELRHPRRCPRLLASSLMDPRCRADRRGARAKRGGPLLSPIPEWNLVWVSEEMKKLLMGEPDEEKLGYGKNMLEVWQTGRMEPERHAREPARRIRRGSALHDRATISRAARIGSSRRSATRVPRSTSTSSARSRSRRHPATVRVSDVRVPASRTSSPVPSSGSCTLRLHDADGTSSSGRDAALRFGASRRACSPWSHAATRGCSRGWRSSSRRAVDKPPSCSPTSRTPAFCHAVSPARRTSSSIAHITSAIDEVVIDHLGHRRQARRGRRHCLLPRRRPRLVLRGGPRRDRRSDAACRKQPAEPPKR